jgi:hypothetical protein
VLGKLHHSETSTPDGGEFQSTSSSFKMLTHRINIDPHFTNELNITKSAAWKDSTPTRTLPKQRLFAVESTSGNYYMQT